MDEGPRMPSVGAPHDQRLPPALARMVAVQRSLADGQEPVPAELWIATGRC